ncbi:MAG: hypothetical protein GXP08_14835 [Gammaproteobacteria bacterium]|nr:hypothetical protein [Gammaproteobacteria bacterium]
MVDSIFKNLKSLMLTALVVVCILMLGVVKAQPQHNEDKKSVSSESQVISAFKTDDDPLSDIVKIDDQQKHIVMFAMGVPLLVFIFVTVGLGVAMGIYGKDVYLAHMIFAGLSLTLALAHAVVGLVWFYPF